MVEGTQLIEGEVQIVADHIHAILDKNMPAVTDTADIVWDREIDAEGNIIMPGFKDAHTHSPMTLLRSFADDLPLQEWLFHKILPVEDLLTEEDIYWASRLAIMEYLTSGITTNFDMYRMYTPNAQASIDSGYRTVYCGTVNQYIGTVDDVEQEYDHFNHLHNLISYQIGFHAEYTCPDQILKDIAALSQKYKAPVYAHISETVTEVQECIQRYHTTPTTYLDSIGMYEYGGGGFHCIHMSDQDLEIYKQKQLFAVTNPSSNLKLASGIAPLVTMIDMGIPLAIGTDGPASNNCLDMFREMFLTTALQKVSRSDAAAMDANQVLTLATVGGARAMGLDDCDCLAPGKKADLILIDLKQPNMQPLNDPTRNIVYSGSKQNVKLTMVNGNILYENGQFHIHEEPDIIYRHVNDSINRLKAQV